MKRRRFGDSGWLWRASLIVLPVAILSGIALAYLREDRAAAEREASDRAQTAAPEAARRVGRRASEAMEIRALRGVLAQGRIESPKDYRRLPEPADWPRTLSPEQARQWQATEAALFQRQDLETARTALAVLAAAGTSAAVRGNAEYRLLLLDAEGGGTRQFAQRALQLSLRFPEARTDAGSALADLSLLLAMRNQGGKLLGGELWPALARRVREHPSFLTPELLAAAEQAAAGDAAAAREVASLKDAWSTQETTLGLMRQLVRRRPDPAVLAEVWLEQDGQAFLALLSSIRNGSEVKLVPAAVLEQAFQSALAAERSQLPAYAAATVEIAGKRFHTAATPDVAATVLASSSGRLEIPSPHPFMLRLVMVDAAPLYARYRRRLWLTAGLILSAAATALASLVSLWQGFRRQVRLSEMKSDFVSSVSHELRSPIAAVRLMAESLDRGKITDESKRRDYFRLIVQQCRRLSSLVENVLDFSRIDQGRKQYRFEPVDPVEIARQTMALMEPCAAERDVSLVLVEPSTDAAWPLPYWDNQAVEQSLVNLLDNAIKHSPPGKTVTMEVETCPALIRYWVEDEGEGIPAEAHAKIFERFYRHGSELRRETQGAGIGLSIVKHVVEAHGGRVMVRSAPGQGSRFGRELPRGRA